ncbi:MAG TPA: TetR/AcrR family transcriptional regulator [Marmoricola sp.]|nr:TetR/AcrR family transcriptional regulator [Marmoricola sp.]
MPNPDASVSDRLLDACIQCMVEHGYVATTTRRVAEMAGVSQGAQQHYFPTKSALVEAAMERLFLQIMADAATVGLDASDERERAEILIERICCIHSQPIAPAIFELFTVARTDPQLAECTARMTGEGMKAIISLAREALPTYAAKPGFEQFVQIAMATARGTAMIAAIPGAEGAYPEWSAVRSQMLAALDELA